MNRPMLIVVGLLVVAGLAIMLFGGPTMLQRIEAADSCGDLGRLYGELRLEVGDALDTEFDQRRRDLGC